MSIRSLTGDRQLGSSADNRADAVDGQQALVGSGQAAILVDGAYVKRTVGQLHPECIDADVLAVRSAPSYVRRNLSVLYMADLLVGVSGTL